ncbi:MAG TPA: BrnT family toxin [Castellaniella sp.]|uniref:BrnT family toxin n=1 Tax=Castellaniella sp. TaxID=1955812 RepID=UPI002F05018F
MRITFDLEKDASNQAKHGVSLAVGANLEWEGAVIWPDLRRDYGEQRMAAIGYIGQRLYYAVFVDRDGGRRMISLRKANHREERRYAKA